MVSFAQIAIFGLSLCQSKPFKKPIYTNILLLIFMCVVLCYNYILILFPDEYSTKWLSLVKFHDIKFNLFIAAVVTLNLICSYLIELYVVPLLGEKDKRRDNDRRNELAS